MEAVLLRRSTFNYDREKEISIDVFGVLNRFRGAAAFVRHRGETPVGALAPAYFEAITIGTLRVMPAVLGVNPPDFARTIRHTVQSERFRSFTGPGANSKEKLENRIQTISDALQALLS